METGICEIKESPGNQKDDKRNKAIKLLYFTDPICSLLGH